MKIALSQLNYKIGDFEKNCQKILQTIQAHEHKADLIVFSELALPGYYPKDLIERPGFVETQNNYLEKIKDYSLNTYMGIILGCITPCPEKSKPFYNSLCLIHQGKIIYRYHKMLLPVYNIFDEARHFSAGNEVGLFRFKDICLGFLICEDGWKKDNDTFYNVDPISQLQQQHPDLIIVINGSPSNIGKQEERLVQFSYAAKKIAAPLLFCNQIGGNDDIVFDGASFCLDAAGKVQGMMPAFAECTSMIYYQHKSITLLSEFSDYKPLSDVELFYRQTLLGLKDYITKCGFKGVVIGLSGGIDSAITCVLAKLALGEDKVVAIAMPSRYSSTHSIDDAIILCHQLNIKLFTIPIEDEFVLASKCFEKHFSEPLKPLAEQNIQARIRGRLLMEYSNQFDILVLSTGNKSELSVGYTTLYGDMAGGINIIGDLYKTDVYRLAKYINQIHSYPLIPTSIMKKAPSAELAPNQKDSDNLLPYNILDPILKLYLEGDLLSAAEKEACLAIQSTQSKDTILSVHRMVDLAEFKRRQAPPIIRMQRRAFGFGRQFPIAAKFELE